MFNKLYLIIFLLLSKSALFILPVCNTISTTLIFLILSNLLINICFFLKNLFGHFGIFVNQFLSRKLSRKVKSLTPSSSLSGVGTETNPFLIYTEADWKYLGNRLTVLPLLAIASVLSAICFSVW